MELAVAAIAAAFRRPEVDLIHATVKPSNQASIRVLEKSGMRRRHYIPEADRVLFTLSRDEWRTANGMDRGD